MNAPPEKTAAGGIQTPTTAGVAFPLVSNSSGLVTDVKVGLIHGAPTTRQKARRAFLLYCAALRDGTPALVVAARRRYLVASAGIAAGRRLQR